MNELKEFKEELLDEQVKANMEIEMGTILGDQEMIDKAKEKIDKLDARIAEIEQEIEKEEKNKKRVEKLGLNEHPQQVYSVIKDLSPKELEELAEETLKPYQGELDSLIEQVSGLKAKQKELEEKILKIKADFMSTHSPTLLTDAKEKMAQYEMLKNEIEKVYKRANELKASEIDPETLRAELIKKMSEMGAIVEPGNKESITYLEEEKRKGKSNEQIAEELNKKSHKTYPEVVYECINANEGIMGLRSVFFDAAWLPNLSAVEETCQKLKEAAHVCEELIKNSEIGEITKGYCQSMMESITKIISKPKEQMLSKTITKEIRDQIDYAELDLDRLQVALTFEILDKVEIPFEDREGLSTDGQDIIATIDDYESLLRSENTNKGIIPGAEDQLRRLGNKIHSDLRLVSKAGISAIGTVEKETNIGALAFIKELEKTTKAEHGHITGENIEDYLFIQQFIKEQAEKIGVNPLEIEAYRAYIKGLIDMVISDKKESKVETPKEKEELSEMLDDGATKEEEKPGEKTY